MSNYSVLKALLDTKFYENNDNEITGTKANEAVKAMVDSLGAGYQFMGVATPATNPSTPDYKCFYVASEPGTYTYFLDSNNTPLVVRGGDVVVLQWDTYWRMGTITSSFEDFVLDAKIVKFPGSTKGQRLAIPYIYKNTLGYGSGVYLRRYDQTEANTPALAKEEHYWSGLPGTKSGVEVLTASLNSGGSIELTIDWDVIPDGYNSLLPLPITIHDNLPGTRDNLENIDNVVFGGSILNNNFDAINWYLPYNRGYGAQVWQGQMTKNKLSGKINGIFIGPFKTSGGSITYEIYSSASETASPSGKTLIKSGIIIVPGSNAGVFSEYFVELPETELNDEFVYVYVSEYVTILGRDTSSVPQYTGGNTHQVIFNVGANWYFGTSYFDAVSPRCVYGVEYPRYFEKVIDDKVASAQTREESVQINLPNKLYAVVGDTLQVFYRSIIEAVDPYAYDIRVVCNKGQGYPRYFQYLPTAGDVGTETLTIRLYNKGGAVVGEKSCQLVTASAPVSPSSVKKVFTFGDSLTSGGEWPNEAQRRLVNTNSVDGVTGEGLSNIDFCGLFEKTRNNQTTHYFGVGGWTWESYTGAGSPAFRFQVSGVTSLKVGAVYSNNGHNYTIMEINVTAGSGNILCSVASSADTPQASGTLTKQSGSGDATIAFSSYSADSQNPLWDYDNNVMTFVPYVNQYGGGQCDVVYVLLSWNNQAAWKTYTLDDTTQISYAKTFARKLHSEYPSAKLKIVGLQMPSLNGGLANNYGADSVYSDVYGLYKCAWNYNRVLQELCNDAEFSGYCEYVDAAAQFDSENNMPESDTAKVNIRNSKTEERGTNGVHPAEAGYYQIGDAVYRNFVANYCQ